MGPKDKISVVKILLLFIFAALFWFVNTRIVIATTPSLPYRVYMKMSPSNIVKGDYVVFPLTNDKYAKEGESLIKQAVCIEGDFLKTINKDYWCNNIFLGKAKDYSLKGDKVDNFIYNGIIETDRVFVLGTHKDSYDSRYFGLIGKSLITAKAYPLW